MEIPRKDMAGRAIQKVHDQVVQSNAGKIPIFVSEFNATYSTQLEVTDSAFMGPWLANTIRECDGLAEMMSYWTFSDVFEEQGVVKTPFYGGYGLVAERGVPKAAYRAFELLHQLGDERIANESPDALITKRKDGALVAAFWNYAEPDEKVGQKTFHLRVTNRSGKSYRLQVVDPANGSALAAWIAMDKPATPTLPQINKLIEASKLAPATEHPMNEAIRLNARALALVTIR
jgi:xylan 1,4-beta-xylosidase